MSWLPLKHFFGNMDSLKEHLSSFLNCFQIAFAPLKKTGPMFTRSKPYYNKKVGEQVGHAHILTICDGIGLNRTNLD